jgi:hypothetical protein
MNFDFGYRQDDGSYVHANHREAVKAGEEAMKVYVSPSSKVFGRKSYVWNTTVYCVRCVPIEKKEECVEGNTDDQK